MADDDKKPWGDDFDEERAWNLIQGLRADKVSLKRERDEARQERDDASKARDEAVAAADTAKKDLATDRRSAVLKEFAIDEDTAEEFLSGDLTLDELRRKAERLSGLKKPADAAKEKDSAAEKDGADKPAEADKPDASDKPDEAPKDKGSKDESDAGSADDAELPERPKPRLSKGQGGSSDSGVDIGAIASEIRGSR